MRNSLKIAYIGGGSRGWARTLMTDLAIDAELCGTMFLYDIDYNAASENAIIGNMLTDRVDSPGKWKYIAAEKIETALIGADVVIISILPATLAEVASDVHAPEKFGIYQSVGDTVGPGGIVRALRAIPMFETIAKAINTYCPEAWVINYTNPMTVCLRTLYKVFPKIKAFGCCHEVFETQKLIADIYNMSNGTKLTKDDIDIEVAGINHFTWIYRAEYKGNDLFPLYEEFVYRHLKDGYEDNGSGNWMNNHFACCNLVKFDLFKRYGAIAAAGDRHLAEFCPGAWYLKNPESVAGWKYSLTPVSVRRKQQQDRIEYSKRLIDGKEKIELKPTGEEGVRQIKAIFGGKILKTNVNLPNAGQIKELPLGCVVETNAMFSQNNVTPQFNGKLDDAVQNLIYRVVMNQECVVEAGLTGDYERAFRAFVNDPLVDLTLSDARKLFDEMLYNTKDYLPFYTDYVK